MKYFKNPRTQGVHAYDDDAPTHFIPDDLIPMSGPEVQAYIAAATAASPEEERTWRDRALVAVIWLRDRHRDQLEIGGPTSLSVAQFGELLKYIQALRDWPQSPDFPQIEHRPAVPSWITEQTE